MVFLELGLQDLEIRINNPLTKHYKISRNHWLQNYFLVLRIYVHHKQAGKYKMNNMNKQELTTLISQNNDCSKKTAEEAIDMFTDGIKQGLATTDEIMLIGFGKFYKQNRKAGEGRNPRTGEKIKIPASVLPKFKPGQALKNACK